MEETPRVGQMADYKQYRGCLITDVDETHKKVLLIVPVNNTTAVGFLQGHHERRGYELGTETVSLSSVAPPGWVFEGPSNILDQ